MNKTPKKFKWKNKKKYEKQQIRKKICLEFVEKDKNYQLNTKTENKKTNKNIKNE